MQTMSQSLAELVRAGKITKADALARAPLPEEVAALLGARAEVPPAANGYPGGPKASRRS